MNAFLKPIIVGSLALVVATEAVAQSAVEWTQFHGSQDSTRLCVDAYNNVHRLMVTGPLGFLVTYNRVGQMTFNAGLGLSGLEDKTLADARVAGNNLIVSVRTKAAPYTSFTSLFNVATRTRTWSVSNVDRQALQVHAKNNVFATVDQLDQAVAVAFRSAADGSITNNVTLPNSRVLLGSDQDTQGNLYVVTKAISDAEVRLFRVNPNGTIAYQRLLLPNPNPYLAFFPAKVVVNPTTQRVLVMMNAHATAPAARPILIYDAPWSTGLGVFHTVSFGDSHGPRGLVPLPNGDFVVTAFMIPDAFNLFPSFHIARYAGSTRLWHLPYGFTIPFWWGVALSNDNTFSVNYTEGFGIYPTQRVQQRDLDTGKLLWTGDVDGENFEPETPLTTAYGNVIVSGQNTFVHQLRGLVTSFPVANLPGGNSTSLLVTLTSDAPTGGAVVKLSSSVPEFQVPADATVPAGQRTVSVPCTSVGTHSNKIVLVTARWAGFSAYTTLTLLAPSLIKVAISPNQVTGGQPTTGTVTLSAKAPAGGSEVELMSGSLSAIVPPTVTVPAGATSATFPVTTQPVGANAGIVISALHGTVNKSAFFAVNAPLLSTFTLQSNSLKGGTNGELTVTLNGNAPTAGYSILLASGAPGLVVLPSSTSVPGGTQTRTLSFVTKPVSASINITLVAYRGSVIRLQTLTLTP